MAHVRPRCLLLAALLSATASLAAAEVTIYRCTDTQGQLSLRDTPCRKTERQQIRAMLRPSDPAPGPARIAAAATPSASTTPPRIVVVHAPRPLYECVTDDGARYPSDTREGNPRWVPLAIFGYPAYPRYDQSHGPGNDTGGRWQYRSGPLGRVDFGRPLRPAWTAHVPRPYPLLAGVDRGIPAGTWIRDTCHALPQQDVCDRLRDRRYQLDRRYHSALQSERAQISTEQRGIDARLSNDCGMY